MVNRRQWLKSTLAAASVGTAAMLPARAASAPIRRLLFVHGRGQGGFEPDELKAYWMATLARGAKALGRKVPDVDVAFPFYGKVLDGYANAVDIPQTYEGARGSTVDEKYLDIQKEFVEGALKNGNLTEAEIDTEFGGPPGERGPLNWPWVLAGLRVLDKHGGGGLGDTTLQAFTRDVYLYVTRAGVRDEIDAIVSAKLTQEPTLVVGHSLGSVVAYSVLSRDSRKLEVPLYVSVGCPLAVRSIQKQFRPLRFPKPVGTWYNAFDTRDTVALYPLDAANFPIAPSVDNYGKVKNATYNHHGIIGYLDDVDVAMHILDALGG